MSLESAFELALVKFRDYVAKKYPNAYEVHIDFKPGGVVEYEIVERGYKQFVHFSDASSSEKSV